jgi:SAM-dependent methyltransferase
VIAWLKERRVKLENRLSSRGLDHTLSALRYGLHECTSQIIGDHARGEALDVGSGRSPYLAQLRTRCTGVVSLDAEERSLEVDLVGDVQDMQDVGPNSFDTILCTQVLEHVPQPPRAFGEFRRVLKPGGKLLLTVPHLSAVHESPHDYYRFTRYALVSLCEEAGLDVLEVREVGGLLSFVAHGFSYVAMSTVGLIPGLGWLTWTVNYAVGCRLVAWMDRILGMRATYPCNILLVARVPREHRSFSG